MALLAACKSKLQANDSNNQSRGTSTERPDQLCGKTPTTFRKSAVHKAVATCALQCKSRRCDSVASAFGNSLPNGSTALNSEQHFSELLVAVQNGQTNNATLCKQVNVANLAKATF